MLTTKPREFPYLKTKSMSTTHKKQVTRSHQKQAKFGPHTVNYDPPHKKKVNWVVKPIPVNFDHPHKNQVKRSPYEKQVTSRPPKKTSQLLSPHWNQDSFGPYMKSKWLSARTQRNQFRPPHEIVNFDTHTATKSISTPHTNTKLISTSSLKRSRFRSPPWYQDELHAPMQNRENLIQTIQTSHFRPPQTNQLDSGLGTKIKVNSDPLYWNQVNFTPPHWNQVNFDHPQKNMSFDHTKNKWSLARTRLILTPRTKKKSIESLHQNQAISTIHTKTRSNDLYMKNKSLPDLQKNKPTTIPAPKPRLFRSIYENQVKVGSNSSAKSV